MGLVEVLNRIRLGRDLRKADFKEALARHGYSFDSYWDRLTSHVPEIDADDYLSFLLRRHGLDYGEVLRGSFALDLHWSILADTLTKEFKERRHDV